MTETNSHGGPEPDEHPPKQESKTGPLTIAGVGLALARRPVLAIAGMLLCALVALFDFVLGPATAESLFNLATYLPVMAGGWAVYAAATPSEEGPRGQLPSVPVMLAFGSTALVVIFLSGLANLVIPIIGAILVKIAFALGPTVALAESAWPPKALWRALRVLDDAPKSFLITVAVSVGVAFVTAGIFAYLLKSILGDASGGLFLNGLSRGLGWVIISGIWMRFYLGARERL